MQHQLNPINGTDGNAASSIQFKPSIKTEGKMPPNGVQLTAVECCAETAQWTPLQLLKNEIQSTGAAGARVCVNRR